MSGVVLESEAVLSGPVVRNQLHTELAILGYPRGDWRQPRRAPREPPAGVGGAARTESPRAALQAEGPRSSGPITPHTATVLPCVPLGTCPCSETLRREPQLNTFSASGSKLALWGPGLVRGRRGRQPGETALRGGRAPGCLMPADTPHLLDSSCREFWDSREALCTYRNPRKY